MSAKSKLTEAQLQMAKQLAPEAVRQEVLARPLTQVGLSRVFAVLPNWESEELARAQGVTDIKTPEMLESALKERSDYALLVRTTACSTLEALKPILDEAHYSRTVFFEYQG